MMVRQWERASDKNMDKTILKSLEEHGYHAQIIPITHLAEVQESLASLKQQGLFDASFFDEELRPLRYQIPDGMDAARSLIIVACADPQVRINFTWGGKLFSAVVPPTYLYVPEKTATLNSLLEQILQPYAVHAVQVYYLPAKTLAVRSGLARYGKNNITYIEGFGSYHRLTTYFSDLPCSDDPWSEAQVMQRCLQCSVCQKACPTSAISSDRFLLHGERCLTYWNEKDAQIAFPPWIRPDAQNCLVGCMACQNVCPENRRFKENIQEGVRFSEEETRMLLAGTPTKDIPGEMLKKLKQYDMINLLSSMPRNLAVLLPR